MAANPFDLALEVTADTADGEAGLKRAADGVRQIGERSEEAAAKAGPLADALDALGNAKAAQAGLTAALQAVEQAGEAFAEAEQKAAALATQLTAAQAAAAQSRAGYAQAAVAAKGLTAEQERLKAALAAGGTEVSGAAEELKRLSAAAKENQSQLDGAWRAVTKLQTQISKAKAPSAELTAEFQRQYKAVQDLGNKQLGLNQEVSKQKAVVDRQKAAQAGLRGELNQVGAALKQAKAGMSEYGNGLRAAAAQVNKTKDAIARQEAAVAKAGQTQRSAADSLAGWRIKAKAAGLSTTDLARNASDLTAKGAKLKSELVALQKEFGGVGDKAKGAGAGTKEAAAGFGGLANALKGVAVAAVAKQLFDAGAAAENMQRGLAAATGSAESGAEALAFIQGEAQRLGIGINKAAQSYTSFASATRGTPLEGAKAASAWASLSAALAATGGTSADVSGALVQLGQGVSKGKFELDDLKAVAERIPGGFGTMARAMGVSTEEFFRMQAAGEVLAVDLIPKLDAELRKVGGGMEEIPGLSAEAARTMNVLNAAMEQVASSGAGGAATGAMQVLQEAIATASVWFVTASARVEQFGASLGVLTAAASSGDFSLLSSSMREIAETADGKISKAVEQMDRLTGESTAAAGGLDATATAAEKAAAATQALVSAAGKAGTVLTDAAKQAESVGKAQLDAAKAAESLAKAINDEAGALAAANDSARLAADLARQKADFDAGQLAISPTETCRHPSGDGGPGSLDRETG
jgi:tape measure domain-containing protein